MNYLIHKYRKLLGAFSQQEPIEPLPQGYKRVEYLENDLTNKQFMLATWSRLEIGDIIKVKCSVKDNGIYRTIFGYNGLGYEDYFSNFDLGHYGGYTRTISDIGNKNTNEIRDIKLEVVKTINSFCYVFVYSASGNRYALNGRIYGYSVIRNNETIYNVLPCLDDNDIPCMYDTVSKRTFYKLGTGEDFLYGAIIN